ncbi:MAG: 3-hydroxyacyl-CoA dehydrogenase family protein [Deltaproteobacteria bacterium]|nr:3-hydroxyacyl-CoA dehydrogenase family protein [Deltaproteobacteria bacterium]
MEAAEIKTIAIVGAGDMGHGIAELCAMANVKVNLYDIKQEFVDKGKTKIKESLEKQVSKQKMAADDFNKAMNNIKGFTVLKDAVSNIDFLIEAAPEILDLKIKIFKEIDEAAPKHAILASNTSNMSITEMGAATGRPDKVLGIHFFNPPVMMALVEVIKGQKTSDETMTVSYDFISSLKNFRGAMVPVRVEKDTPGFIFNRVNAPVGLFLAEIYEKGLVEPEAVDAKVRSLGAPMGPYETMDFSGLDVYLHGNEYFEKTLSPEFKPSNWLKKMNEAGTLGKKSEKGIFAWPGGARPTIDMGKADPNFDPMDIFCLQVNEGTKLIQDGVASSAAEIDKAMVNGGGSPFGPFALAQGMGWAKVAERCEAISQKLGIKWFMPTEMLKKGDIQL